MSQTHETVQGRTIAYDRVEGQGPGVVFLGGFMSDKEGTKALALENWAKSQMRAFIRFDYSGHGSSGGDFTDGTIGAWVEDALSVLAELTEGPQVLVGSSMGGWISLLLCRQVPERIGGLVTIAAAPDFTEAMWDDFDPDQRDALLAEGSVRRPSDYDEPYTITRALIEDGRQNLVFDQPLKLDIPVRYLQGDKDRDVSPEVAQRLFDHTMGKDVRLTLVKGADHRFSEPDCLRLIEASVEDVLARVGR